MQNSHTRRIVLIALLIALEIVLTRLLSFQPVPAMRISFGFIAIASMAVLFGPIYAGIGAAAADFLGFILVPPASGAPFFPGFTLTAFLMGVVYGVFLYKRAYAFWRICAAALIITIILQLGLDTIWLWIILEDGVAAMIPIRLVRTLIMAPMQIIALRFMMSERFKDIFGSHAKPPLDIDAA